VVPYQRSFKANWIWRDVVAVLVMTPAEEAPGDGSRLKADKHSAGLAILSDSFGPKHPSYRPYRALIEK